MNMTVHNLMAYNPQYFRPQPVINFKQERTDEKTQSFQDVLNDKMRANSRKTK